MKPITSQKNRARLGFRRILSLLVFLVIVPTVLMLLLGIVLMFIGEAERNLALLFGILLVSFVFVAGTGITLVLVFLRREANLSELQADFVSKLSHEFKTPLTSIRLFVETMQTSKGDTATEERCLEQLSRESERLSRMVDRLLNWGRMEAGRKLYKMEWLSIDTLVAESIHSFAPERYPDLRFHVFVEPRLPLVQGDLSALTDALVNLLSNARKYGGTPPNVWLRAERVGQGVHVSVKDDGEGIVPSEQKRIFDKFYRIDDRLSREREGSGLGLAIVKHVIRAHGARIELNSRAHGGSVFTIVFPPLAKSKRSPTLFESGIEAKERSDAHDA